MATGSQKGGMAYGAGSGAVSGASIGTAISPGYGTAIGAVVGAVAGGVLGFMSGDDGSGAQLNDIYSRYNAIQIERAGATNAQKRREMAGLNSDLLLQSTAFNIGQDFQIDQYNANLKSFLGDYNASLLEDEARYVWEAADLDILQRDNVFARELGQLKTGYGASGVMMNQDSPLTAQIDAKTQHAMDVMVVRYNADTQAKKILDAAAKSRWEGNMAAQSIMYQGNINSATKYGNAALQSAGILTQGGIDADMTLYNTAIQKNQTQMSGNIFQQSWESKDNQAMATGLFQGATTVASAYGRNKEPATTTPESMWGVRTTSSTLNPATSPWASSLLQ